MQSLENEALLSARIETTLLLTNHNIHKQQSPRFNDLPVVVEYTPRANVSFIVYEHCLETSCIVCFTCTCEVKPNTGMVWNRVLEKELSVQVMNSTFHHTACV